MFFLVLVYALALKIGSIILRLKVLFVFFQVTKTTFLSISLNIFKYMFGIFY